MSDDPIIRALFEPATGMIPCVLLQAALGGDRRACRVFDVEDWNVGFPDDSTVMIEASLSQWRQVANMSRQERIERFKDRFKTID